MCSYTQLMAQEDSSASLPEPASKTFVKSTFECPSAINNQTVSTLNPKTLQFMIQHRFGLLFEEEGNDKVELNTDDLLGLFSPSNIRFGLDYGITKRFMIGGGVTKNKRLYDMSWKYLALKQAKSGGLPFSLSYYGVVSRTTVNKDNLANQDKEYVWANRLSYFNEIMLARKLNSKFSIQFAGSYSYVNIVESYIDSSDKKHIDSSAHTNSTAGLHLTGRYKFTPQSSVIIEFDYPLSTIPVNKPKPNLGLAYEISTGTHQFQVFVCTADAINNTQIMMFNLNDFTKRQILLGFNITRNWSF